MLRSLTKRRIAAFLFLAIPGFALAQAPSPAGGWEGAIELPGLTIAMAVKGDVLTANVSSQPQYTLEPYRGTEYRFKELTSYSIRFLPDAKGVVNEALVIQPDGVYKAKRTGREGGPS